MACERYIDQSAGGNGEVVYPLKSRALLCDFYIVQLLLGLVSICVLELVMEFPAGSIVCARIPWQRRGRAYSEQQSRYRRLRT